MKYNEIINSFCSAFLCGETSRLWVGERFWMVDNLSGGSSRESGTPARLPIKISMSFCIFCKSGSMSVRIQQHNHTVTAGQMLVIFAGQILEKVRVEGDLRVIFMSIDSEFIMTQVRSRYRNILSGILLRSSEPTLVRLGEEDAACFENLYSDIKAILKTLPEDCADGVLSGYISIFGSMLASWLREDGQTAEGMEKELQPQDRPDDKDRTRSDRTSKRTCEAVLMRFQSDIHNFSSRFKTVGYYAARQKLSPRHFSRLVKTASGQDPKDLIKEYVILEAKSLLLSDNYSVHEVASLLGFDNDSFFNRYFKNATGITPGLFLSSASTL
ncbi:MAG: helix-turn-helix domain-containing protein [Candidatus Cryptobacteroides sp.]